VLLIEDNRVDATLGSGFPSAEDHNRFNEHVERRKLIGIEFDDAHARISASEASEQGKSYDSLPVFRAALYDSYQLLQWRGFRKAASDLSHELLRLNAVDQSMFYAILSEDNEACKAVARYLRYANNNKLVSGAVRASLDICHLARHVHGACSFVQELGDAMPDQYVADWLKRLVPNRTHPINTWHDKKFVDDAWKATAALVPAASAEHSDAIVDEILQGQKWQSNAINRDETFPVLTAALLSMSRDKCQHLIGQVLPHATHSPPSHDYQSAIMFLARIADKWPEFKDTIADTLFTTDKGVPHILI